MHISPFWINKFVFEAALLSAIDLCLLELSTPSLVARVKVLLTTMYNVSLPSDFAFLSIEYNYYYYCLCV